MIPKSWVTLALLLASVAVIPGNARSAPGGPAGRPAADSPPVVRRLRPLELNDRSRAHIRGEAFADLLRRQRGAAGARPGPSAVCAPCPAGGGPRPAVAPVARPTARPQPVARPAAPDRSLLPAWLQDAVLPDLPIRIAAPVVAWLERYRSDRMDRSILAGWLGALPRFERIIRDELRRAGLPQALIYVAMIESGFDPRTVSHAGAAGPWQFMPYGGAIYGLHRSFWVEERFNPERSTRAVTLYLADLYHRFGSWELALAAYNAGYGCVSRAVAKYNTNDYWRLLGYEAGLPYETTTYVPKLMAAAIAALNLDRFGLRPGPMRPAWDYALVEVPGGTPLQRVAQQASVTVAAVRTLNPELLRHRVPPGPLYELRIPRAALATYLAHAPRDSAADPQVITYQVKRGDTIQSIAADHGVSLAEVRQLNQVRQDKEVTAGEQILIPVARGAARTRPVRDDRPVLAFPRPAAPEPTDHRTVYYPVVAGDTLPSVARALGVEVAALLRWNALDPLARLTPGLVLRAWVPAKALPRGVRLLDPTKAHLVEVDTEPFHELHLARRGLRRLTVVARRGDTLQRLAARHGVTVGSAQRASRLPRSAKLTPGQQVVLYVKAGKGPRAVRRPTTARPGPRAAPRPAPRPAPPPRRPAPGRQP